MPLTVLLLSHLPLRITPLCRAGDTHWSIRVKPSLHLDLNIHTSGQFEFHQGIDRLARGVENVDQSLMRTCFKLLARFFVDVRGPVHHEERPFGRQRDGTRHNGTGRLHGFDDLLRRFIDQVVIVRLQLDTNLLTSQRLILAD